MAEGTAIQSENKRKSLPNLGKLKKNGETWTHVKLESCVEVFVRHDVHQAEVRIHSAFVGHDSTEHCDLTLNYLSLGNLATPV